MREIAYGSFCFTGNCVAFPVKQKVLRVDRTAAERNLSLREPPQAENLAEQDPIWCYRKSRCISKKYIKSLTNQQTPCKICVS